MSFKNQADFIITRCGGVGVVSAWLDLPYHVVWAWPNRSASGYIPAEFQAKVLIKARENGVDLSESDILFPPLAGSIAHEMVGGEA